MRSGWVKAITRPATKLASGRCAARPTTRPITAEEASSPPATARTCGTTSSAERTPIEDDHGHQAAPKNAVAGHGLRWQVLARDAEVDELGDDRRGGDDGNNDALDAPRSPWPLYSTACRRFLSAPRAVIGAEKAQSRALCAVTLEPGGGWRARTPPIEGWGLGRGGPYARAGASTGEGACGPRIPRRGRASTRCRPRRRASRAGPPPPPAAPGSRSVRDRDP